MMKFTVVLLRTLKPFLFFVLGCGDVVAMAVGMVVLMSD
jgi:hypothetical protein